MRNVVILGTAHGSNVAGKRSPDSRLREYAYSREICRMVKAELTAKGVECYIDLEADLEPSLSTRTTIVNNLCAKHGGASNCIYVSIHVNAAGADGKWHNAGGWCAYTTRGVTKADALAECLYDAAREHLKPYVALMDEGKMSGEYSAAQKPFRVDTSDGDSDFESDFWVLRKTACPAVLTENLFQDNRKDVEFLLANKELIVKLHVDGILKYIK